MSATTIDERRLSVLSDNQLYRDAAEFLERFVTDHTLPQNQQLVGLLNFSRSWGELLAFVKHQEGRDWGTRGQDYKQFYNLLRRYLDDPKTGLRQRVKADLGLIPAGLVAKQEREVQEQWAGALAREFIQHLVAAALYHAQTRRSDGY